MTADRWKEENRLAATKWLVLMASSGWLNWRALNTHSQTCCERFLQVKVILSAILQATGHEMNKWHTNEWNTKNGEISLGCSGLQGWQSVSIVIRQGHEETKVFKVYCNANLHERVIRGTQHCHESSNQHFLRSRKKSTSLTSPPRGRGGKRRVVRKSLKHGIPERTQWDQQFSPWVH